MNLGQSSTGLAFGSKLNRKAQQDQAEELNEEKYQEMCYEATKRVQENKEKEWENKSLLNKTHRVSEKINKNSLPMSPVSEKKKQGTKTVVN